MKSYIHSKNEIISTKLSLTDNTLLLWVHLVSGSNSVPIICFLTIFKSLEVKISTEVDSSGGYIAR